MMTNNYEIGSNDINTYDEVPYESYPYSQSHPSHLRTLGLLFGLKAPKLETARILELGCAAGGNLIPIAVTYPNSECVGVDLSAVQIETAKKEVDTLKLKNAIFHQKSITDIDESFGKFDYIICHGVISWVPDFVRDKIFEVCGKLLTENGIAYISYNTLPGWNTVRSIRDMMLYHAASFENINDKVTQARLLLNFIKDSTENQNTPYAQFLKNEAELLANQPDHYLRHDHLEENNYQYYFKDFMGQASAQGLQYLADTSLPSMYIGNMPAKIAQKLSEVNDIVRSEQYMDYVTNRRFRSTLLCRNTAKLNRNLSPDSIKDLYFSMKITAEKPASEVKLEDTLDNVKFYLGNKDSYISTTSPVLKAIFYVFAENPLKIFKISELAKLVIEKLPKVQKTAIEQEFLSNAYKLIFASYMNIHADASTYTDKYSDKPQVSPLVRLQATKPNSLWVTNQKHERLSINIVDKFILRYLDGSNSREQIVGHLLTHIDNGELTLSKGGEKLSDHNTIKTELLSAIDQILSRLSQSALLTK